MVGDKHADGGAPETTDDEYLLEYQWSGATPASVGVIEGASALLETPPERLRPLYEVVDPDALNALFGPRFDGRARTEGHVTFQYVGLDVTVHADGRVVLRNTGDARDDR